MVAGGNGSIIMGLIGASGSGKSTFLGALRPFARQAFGSHAYNVRPNIETRPAFDDVYYHLRKGIFPPATIQERDFVFEIGNNHDVCIRCKTEDRPGGDYFQEEKGQDDYEAIFDYLSKCEGIIFLVSVKPRKLDTSPKIGSDEVDNLLLNLSDKLKKKKNNYDGGRLPHRVSICFTQYDDAQFFKFGCDHNLFLKNITHNQVDNVPFFKDPSEVALDIQKMKILLSWFKDWEESLNVLDHWFYPQQLNFFGISSIGFFIKENQDNRKFVDWEDCINIEDRNQGDQKYRIKSAPNFRPVNLFEPFSWLVSKKRMDPTWIQKIRGVYR